MIRKTLAIFFLLGLLTSAGAWAASYWNWEYTHWKTEVALWGGTVVYRQHDAPPDKDAGWRCYGWISWPQTQWWPQRGSSLTHEWTVYPLWMPAALFAVLYYGLKLILLLRSFYREMHDRCRVCGIEVQDTLLCCRTCQTPVSMLIIGRGALSQVFIHLFILTIGLTAASYWHYSWTLKNGTTLALTRGSTVVSWAGGYRPAKHKAGFMSWRTNWVPKFNSSPFTALGAAPIPATSVGTNMGGPVVLGGTTYYFLPDGTVTTTPPLVAPVPTVRTLIIPFWIPLGVVGYVVWRLRFSPANLRRRRIKLGLCLTCGYDLRASEDRCPECGTEFAMRSIEEPLPGKIANPGGGDR